MELEEKLKDKVYRGISDVGNYFEPFSPIKVRHKNVMF